MPISKLRRMLGDEKWKEYQRLRANEKAEAWKSRNGTYVVDWRRRVKRKLIAYKGGKCERCGYDKDIPTAYAFHHQDPSQKEFSISQSGNVVSYKRCLAEVDKCLLLCNRCHSEVHHELQIEADKKYIESLKDRTQSYRDRMDALLASVPEEVKQRIARPRMPRISRRPNKEELEALVLNGESWMSIGRKYSVSEAAVRKWVRFYAIPFDVRISPRIPEFLCIQCQQEYKPSHESQKFCSQDCQAIASRKIKNRPSKEELQSMLETQSYAAIARLYDVRRDTVVKWGVRYGIQPTKRMNKHTKGSINDLENSI